MPKLNVVVPYRGCDKQCPFCISAMNRFTEPDYDLMLRNVKKASALARQMGAQAAMLTSEGEPTLSTFALRGLARAFQLLDWPLELQTNGKRLLQNESYLVELAELIDLFAISVDTPTCLMNVALPLARHIKALGRVSRLTILLNRAWERESLEIAMMCSDAHQVVFKRLVVPPGCEETPQAKWIEENQAPGLCQDIQDEFYDLADIARLHSGYVRIYGKSVSLDYDCIAPGRSLIFHEDGHVYTEWNPASILF